MEETIEFPKESLPQPKLEGRHPGIVALYKFFEFGHLPPHLAIIALSSASLAASMIDLLPDGPELTVGLRKLLEAKDCFVRAEVAVHWKVEK